MVSVFLAYGAGDVDNVTVANNPIYKPSATVANNPIYSMVDSSSKDLEAMYADQEDQQISMATENLHTNLGLSEDRSNEVARLSI